MAYYCWLPGMPKKLKWPVHVTNQESDAGEVDVFCHSDNATFRVNIDQLQKFPDESLFERGLEMLKKKPATLRAFKTDVQWVLAEEHYGNGNQMRTQGRKRRSGASREHGSGEVKRLKSESKQPPPTCQRPQPKKPLPTCQEPQPKKPPPNRQGPQPKKQTPTCQGPQPKKPLPTCQEPQPKKPPPNRQGPQPKKLPPTCLTQPKKPPPNRQGPQPKKLPSTCQGPQPKKPPPTCQEPQPDQPPPTRQGPQPKKPPPTRQEPQPDQPPPTRRGPHHEQPPTRQGPQPKKPPPTRRGPQPEQPPPTRQKPQPKKPPPTRQEPQPKQPPPTRQKAQPDHPLSTCQEPQPDHPPPSRQEPQPYHPLSTCQEPQPDHPLATCQEPQPEHPPSTCQGPQPEHPPPTCQEPQPDHPPPTCREPQPEHPLSTCKEVQPEHQLQTRQEPQPEKPLPTRRGPQPEHSPPTCREPQPEHPPPTCRVPQPDHPPPTRLEPQPEHPLSTCQEAQPEHQPQTRREHQPKKPLPTRQEPQPKQPPPTLQKAQPDHPPPSCQEPQPEHPLSTCQEPQPDHPPPSRQEPQPDHPLSTCQEPQPDHPLATCQESQPEYPPSTGQGPQPEHPPPTCQEPQPDHPPPTCREPQPEHPLSTCKEAQPEHQLQTRREPQPKKPLPTRRGPQPEHPPPTCREPQPDHPPPTCRVPQPDHPQPTRLEPQPEHPLSTCQEPQPEQLLSTCQEPQPEHPLSTCQEPQPEHPLSTCQEPQPAHQPATFQETKHQLSGYSEPRHQRALLKQSRTCSNPADLACLNLHQISDHNNKTIGIAHIVRSRQGNPDYSDQNMILSESDSDESFEYSDESDVKDKTYQPNKDSDPEDDDDKSSVIFECISDVSVVQDSDPEENSDTTIDISPTSSKLSDLNKVDDIDSDEDVFEKNDDLIEKVHEILNKDMYVSKLVKSKTTKLGKAKKSERVYNSTSVCPFCRRPQTNFSHHLFSKKHIHESEVQNIKEKEETNTAEKKRLIEILRLKGNHFNNLAVNKNKRGQIRLLRRKELKENEEFFDLDDYGPCPCCFGWILKKNLKRHNTNCAAKDVNLQFNSLTYLVVQSDILAGRVSSKASKMLVNEVYTTMINDETSQVAKDDELIVNLGNQWIKRNVGNKIMRRYYTSSVMRLAAKLLIQLRLASGENLDMTTFVSPKYFDHFVVAALKCSKQDSDDEEDLQSPSNCIKLGYDIKRLASAKYALGIANEDQIRKKEGKDFLTLMNIRWHTEVTRLAREVLVEKSMNKTRALPLPVDVKDLSEYMKQTLEEFNVANNTNKNFRYGATVALARLTIYNRRRSHEVQAMRLESYHMRKRNVDSISLEMMRVLTVWEKKLLETQELIEVRGKMAKPVPVIVPKDVIGVLKYLADPHVRKKAGIREENRFLFASNGVGVVRAYDAIKKMTEAADLQMPNLIRTSNMRKYMATMVQCLDTTEAQRQWIITHMGHTMDVHLTHYRQTSDILERVEIAKILLIQDTNQVGRFVGKKMEDIQLEDIVAPDGEVDETPGLEAEPDVMPDMFQFHDETLDADNVKKAKVGQPVRQKWTVEEEKELRVLFSVNILTKKCPKKHEIEKAVRKSMKNGGLIHLRKPDNIKKKMSNMIIKLRSERS